MPVLSEIATMTEVAQGTSLARFGHGELAIMNGEDARFQKYDPLLAMELRSILKSSPCLVCVPHTRGKNGWQWEKFLKVYGKDIDPDRWYGSSFVSRADEVAWSEEYGELVAGVLRGYQPYRGAKTDAFDSIDHLESEIIARGIEPVLLSCGAAATVLAHRLAVNGVWAVDIGSLR